MNEDRVFEYYCGEAYGQTPGADALAWRGLRCLCDAHAASLVAERMYAVRLPGSVELPCERCRPETKRAGAVHLSDEKFLQVRRAALGLTDEAVAARQRRCDELIGEARATDARVAAMFAEMTWLPPLPVEMS